MLALYQRSKQATTVLETSPAYAPSIKAQDCFRLLQANVLQVNLDVFLQDIRPQLQLHPSVTKLKPLGLIYC